MSKASLQMKSSETLIYADSASNADMWYFSGVHVGDPFIAFSAGGKRYGILSQLEFSRVKKSSCFDEVILLEDFISDVRGKQNGVIQYPASLIAHVQKVFKIKQFCVAPDFPLGLAQKLTELGVNFTIAEDGLFPEREFKSDEEVGFIKEGNRASVAGFKAVEAILKRTEIRKNYLYYEGKRLTSERVRAAIFNACLELGALPIHTIVAGGDQACDPHCVGEGPLKANELIIVDIFPRVEKTGYFGDMTRTYLKGKASEAQKALYQTVLDAQQWALGEFKTKKSGQKITETIVQRFETAGYRTHRDGGTPVGFIHGLGHGLGLEIHEAPRVNLKGSMLKTNQVITVEPGLYYPGLGGVRVEDVVRVKPQGPEYLSKHSYKWEF